MCIKKIQQTSMKGAKMKQRDIFIGLLSKKIIIKREKYVKHDGFRIISTDS
jgi:hypothetical protein